MASAQQKAFFVLRFSQCESVSVTFLIIMVLILLHHRALDDGMHNFKKQVVCVKASHWAVPECPMKTWSDGFEYRTDICRVSKGGHIEHL
ncbi:hypothetical protein J6590_093694 [Homalodisca vitripennis]|nr:hypothetical protein J6590_093694 [Homalodisca vitripennis]